MWASKTSKPQPSQVARRARRMSEDPPHPDPPPASRGEGERLSADKLLERLLRFAALGRELRERVRELLEPLLEGELLVLQGDPLDRLGAVRDELVARPFEAVAVRL